MNEPVTWLMPVKNGMPYLGRTLESIAAQTYQNHSIIVWDNGSTDGTVAELRRWIPARIPGIVITGRAMSIGRSLAALVDTAPTELCARIDADDINLPTRLERQVAHMLAHREVVALGTQVRLIDAHDRPLPGHWICPTEDAEARWRTRWLCSLTHPSVMFRKSAVLQAGNYADLVTAEDFELWLRLCYFGEIHNLPDELFLYRRHAASMTSSDFSQPVKRLPNNTTDLFPGLAGEQALRLWSVTDHSEMRPRQGVSIWHLLQHAHAARLLARKCGKPDHYFQKTRTYKEQRYWLRRNLLRSAGVAHLADRHRGQLRVKRPETA
jgi:glycosyltransferase involved in cell wall biosynthesis